MLWRIEVLITNGKTAPQACKEATMKGADVLPLAERVRRFENGSDEEAERNHERN